MPRKKFIPPSPDERTKLVSAARAALDAVWHDDSETHMLVADLCMQLYQMGAEEGLRHVLPPEVAEMMASPAATRIMQNHARQAIAVQMACFELPAEAMVRELAPLPDAYKRWSAEDTAKRKRPKPPTPEDSAANPYSILDALTIDYDGGVLDC